MILRLHHRLVDKMRADLRRRHPFAAERVGFLWAKPPPREGSPVQIATEYSGLADDDYIKDRFVGARFSGAAIRSAMERTLATGSACFHVHMHDHSGETDFSNIDRKSMAEFVPPFSRLVPAASHGALVLSSDDACGAAWDPQNETFTPIEVSVVGFPMLLPWRTRYV